VSGDGIGEARSDDGDGKADEESFPKIRAEGSMFSPLSPGHGTTHYEEEDDPSEEYERKYDHCQLFRSNYIQMPFSCHRRGMYKAGYCAWRGF